MINIKRAYESPTESDGLRILVDRVWPRGITRQELKLHEWKKGLAPSTMLRKWFGHDPKRWIEFKRRYRAELEDQRGEMRQLKTLSAKHTITLVYGAKDEIHNQAVALKEFISK